MATNLSYTATQIDQTLKDIREGSTDDLNIGSGTLVVDKTNNRVGIGVGSPSTQFHLEGTVPYIRSKNTSASTDKKTWDFNAGTDGKFRFRSVNDAGSDSNNWLQVDRDGVDINAINFYTGNELMCIEIDSSGKVGIGKTPSTWFLDVDSTGTEIASFDGSNDTGIVINSSASESDIIGYSNSNISYNSINIRGASGTGLVVDTSNNVGIGGTPLTELHIMSAEKNGVGLRLQSSDTGGETWDIVSSGTLNTTNAGDLGIFCPTGVGLAMVIEHDTGNVGIGGEASPKVALHVEGGTTGLPDTSNETQTGVVHIGNEGGITFGRDSGNDYASWMQAQNPANTGTERHLLLQPVSGNVGIGTSTPSKRLHVIGDSLFIGNVGIGTTTPEVGSTKGVDIENTTTHGATEGGCLRLTANDGTGLLATHRLGAIEFAGTDATSISVGARIEAVATNSWTGSRSDSALGFWTTEDLTQSQKMWILHNGNVGIGKTPSSKLDIKLSTEDLEIVNAGSTSPTEQDWIEVKVGGNQGYIRVYATK